MFPNDTVNDIDYMCVDIRLKNGHYYLSLRKYFTNWRPMKSLD